MLHCFGWPLENVRARALQSFFRITVIVQNGSLLLDNRQQCWQLLRPFVCTTQQVPTLLANNDVTCCVRLRGP